VTFRDPRVADQIVLPLLFPLQIGQHW